MEPPAVVVHKDEITNGGPSLLPGSEGCLVNQLFFEGCEEALDIGVIQARTRTGEARSHTCSRQRPGVGGGRILTALVLGKTAPSGPARYHYGGSNPG